jgi:thiol-disulfide isomerase/thioredoxin
VLATSFSYANNVLIKIDNPEGIFNKCTLQRTFYGNISNVPVEQTEPLIIATGTEMELQVDSFLVCFIINQDQHFFYQPLFITAGDTITFTSHKVRTDNGYILYKLIASGKNESNYNFLADSHNNYDPYVAIDEKNTDEYIKYYKGKRDVKLSLLKTRKASLSIPFYNYALAEIQNSYAWDMYRKGLNNDANIVINSLSPYCYVASWEKFCLTFSEKERGTENALKYLTNNYSGRNLEFLLTNYISWCVKNNLLISPKAYSAIKENVHDMYYLSCINFFKKMAQINNKMLPDSVLNKTYLIEYITNRKITLKEFFAEQTNELCYIDFWASWCTACRWVIRETKEGKEVLKNKQMQLVYFSIDADENRWRKAVADDKIEDSPNYLIVDGNKSPLCRYIYVKSIPHYALVNKNGVLIQAQATRLEELH